MSPYMAMIKVLTILISYSSKRRHKRGVHSENTSLEYGSEVSFSKVGIYQSLNRLTKCMLSSGFRCQALLKLNSHYQQILHRLTPFFLKNVLHVQ